MTNMLNEDVRKLVLSGLIGLLLLSMILIPFVLYDTVDETEYGIMYSTWDKSIDDEQVYGAGRHYTGLFKSFITFPSTQQSVEFIGSQDTPITGRTQDGLAITIDVSFQYQLIRDGVIQLYRDFGQDYENNFFRVGRDVLRDVSSLYTAIQFFNNRTSIGMDMEQQIRETFVEYYADVPGLQLRSIDLPNSFEEALERAEVARQEVEIARLQQQEALIRAETRILEAEAQRNVTLIEANATAQAFIIQIEAQAEALNITLTAQRESYYAFSQELNLTSAELLSFLWIQALTEIGEFGNLVIIGSDTPVIIDSSTNTTSSL